MKYHNGNIYEGCWKNDYRDGSGKMESSNGEVYDGEVIKIIITANTKAYRFYRL